MEDDKDKRRRTIESSVRFSILLTQRVIALNLLINAITVAGQDGTDDEVSRLFALAKNLSNIE